jgi:hypothetical protein
MNRRGAALPLALLALIVLSALAGAALVSARLRWLGGYHAFLGTSARISAESAVEQDVRRWNSLLADTLRIGAVAPGSAAGGAGLDSILRLGRTLFLVHAVGERRAADGRLLARQGAAQLVELAAPRLLLGAALTVHGPADVGSGAVVAGTDRVPTGWAPRCPPADSLNQEIRYDSMAGFDRLAPVGTAELLEWADFQIGGDVAPMGSVFSVARGCDVTVSGNWGDPETPAAPCWHWFPLIAAAAGSRITSGVGQGMLVAPHGIEFAGDARFYGVVVTRGPVVLRDNARVVGAVFSDSGAVLLGGARIERSDCAARMALSASGRNYRPLPRRRLRWP